ncbi:hypothetical protein BJY52DRAFT_1224987 [Lactarius psammicola]|nr:hypothetical protein BJY52DRAFT_1224987 [Lactarius psammicola]
MYLCPLTRKDDSPMIRRNHSTLLRGRVCKEGVPQLASLDQEVRSGGSVVGTVQGRVEAPSAGATEIAVFFLEQVHRRSVTGLIYYVRMEWVTSRNQKEGAWSRFSAHRKARDTDTGPINSECWQIESEGPGGWRRNERTMHRVKGCVEAGEAGNRRVRSESWRAFWIGNRSAWGGYEGSNGRIDVEEGRGEEGAKDEFDMSRGEMFFSGAETEKEEEKMAKSQMTGLEE